MRLIQNQKGNVIIFALVAILIVIIAGLVFYIWQNNISSSTESQIDLYSKNLNTIPTVINSSSSANENQSQNPETSSSTYQNPFEQSDNPFNNLQ